MKKPKLTPDQKKFLSKVPRSYVPPPHMVNPAEETKHVRIVKAILVKNWIIRGWTLTSQQAWKNFGVTRLADIIWRMRKNGFTVVTKMIDGTDRFMNTVHYAKYKINKIRSKKAIQRYNKLKKRK